MKLQKIALVIALATAATAASAAESVAIDTGVTSILADLANRTDGAYINLSLNNVDKVDGSVKVALPSLSAFENSIETTAIGVVQSGSLEYQTGILENINKTQTRSDTTVSNNVDTTVTKIDKTTDINTSQDLAKTSSTSASTSADTTTKTDTSDITNNINKTVTNNVTSTLNDTTLTSMLTDVGVYNIAYNKAEIDGSISISSTAPATATGPSAIGGSAAKWTTTAIGSVQSGNIKVTVK